MVLRAVHSRSPKRTKKESLDLKNGGQNFLSRRVMMICYQLQDKIEVEGGREGETQGWIGDIWSAVAKCDFSTAEFNIERIKRVSSAVS